MSRRRYVTRTGRVVSRTRGSLDPGLARVGHRESLDGEDVIGDVWVQETRFELRRTYVHREWVLALARRFGTQEFRGPTRRDVIRSRSRLARPGGLVMSRSPSQLPMISPTRPDHRGCPVPS